MKTDMLLIFFLGLIATLTSVCDGRRDGIRERKHFDYYKFSGPRLWYPILHSPSDAEDDIDCFVVTWASPEENTSLITAEFYQFSEQSHVTIYGNATNWNSAGYWDQEFHPTGLWTGRHHVIAVDYDRYIILKFFPIDSNTPHIYVGYRSQHPNEETVKRVRKDLRENNIDYKQLVNWPVDHCQ